MGDACTRGVPLTEKAFEQLNELPLGTLSRLREYCNIKNGLRPGTELTSGALYLIFQGGLGVVDQINHDDEEKSPSNAALEVMEVHMKGYFGRRGVKRLRKRYPPGSIAGGMSFLLQVQSRHLRAGFRTSIIVSNKFSNVGRVWELTREKWEQLPGDLRQSLNDLMLTMSYEEQQHTQLSGE